MADADSTRRAVLLATLSSELTYGSLPRRLAYADEAKAMARRLGDPATIVLVCNLISVSTDVPTTLETRVRDAEETLLLAEALGDPSLVFWASVFRRIPAMQAGDVESGVRCLERMRVLSERLGQPTLRWVTRYNDAAQAIFEGVYGRAEALVLDALPIGNDSGQPDAFAFYGAQFTLLRLGQGRMGELVPLLAQLAHDTPGVVGYTAALGLAHLEAGDEAEARSILDAGARDGFSSVPFDNAWLAGMACYSEVSIELADRESAAALLELLTPYCVQTAYTGLTPHEPTALYTGGLATVLGRHDLAESHFAEATELNRRGRRTISEARTELAWGRMLARRRADGDLERALDLLQRSRTTFAEHRLERLEARAANALSHIDDGKGRAP